MRTTDSRLDARAKWNVRLRKSGACADNSFCHGRQVIHRRRQLPDRPRLLAHRLAKVRRGREEVRPGAGKVRPLGRRVFAGHDASPRRGTTYEPIIEACCPTCGGKRTPSARNHLARLEISTRRRVRCAATRAKSVPTAGFSAAARSNSIEQCGKLSRRTVQVDRPTRIVVPRPIEVHQPLRIDAPPSIRTRSAVANSGFRRQSNRTRL